MAGSSTPTKGGGIYRNLMMPGFADAGAGTTYVPNTVIPRRTAATGNLSTGSGTASSVGESSNANIQTNTDTSSHAEETFSEAGTELHDNRTNKNSGRYYNIKTVQSNNHANNTSNDSTEVEANFGFFPSTKPPPSPSPRGNAGTLAAGGTPKRGTRQQPTPPSPSPQPRSPPPVTRKQLVAADSDANQKTPRAGTKTTTTLSPTIEERSFDEGDADGTESKNQPQQLALDERPLPIQMGMMKREVSTFSLAPETGAVVDREENQAKLKQWKEKEVLHQKVDEENEIESDGDTSPEDTIALSAENDNANDQTTTRRLDLNALQEIDRIEGKKSKDSDELSTSSSIVSSTCSEFGTVIQLGEAAMAARMKEVEEMELAALAEVPSEDHDTVPQLSSTSLLQHDNSSGKIDTANKKSDAKTTVATANSAISPRRPNPTKSEMVSAAFRRVNLNNGTVFRGDKKPRSSMSAPTTPMRKQNAH